MKSCRLRIWTALMACMTAARLAALEPIADTPFVQEVHEPRPVGSEPRANDVRAVAVEVSGAAWTATADGAYSLAPGEVVWTRPAGTPGVRGPAYDVAITRSAVWIGAWDGLHRLAAGRSERIDGVAGPISALSVQEEVVFAGGHGGFWRIEGRSAARLSIPSSRGVRALAVNAAGKLVAGTGLGLAIEGDPAASERWKGHDDWSSDVRGLALASGGDLWAVGLGGAQVFAKDGSVRRIGARDGIPSIDARCVAIGPDGRVWVGTAHGVARFDGTRWSLRHSRRWLLSDEVRDVAFGKDGAAWIATAGGVSVIRPVEMTLATKAKRFLDACLARHIREPGLVEKCRLRVPGDVTTWEPRDDDNDGEYTSLYLAMQSFHFAATKDPEAREAAKRAFEALRFLQTVTGTPSFVARTVVPSTWTSMADPNEAISDEEWAERRVEDPRSKRVELRWRPSADGKWLWKGDTSSDEITGHLFGYLVYHDFAADEAGRKAVAEHVARIVDGIVAGGFVLLDIDGLPTRWGVWSPEKLHRDPDWALERGVNSVEILSYLKLARHVTGDVKYDAVYRRLLDEHGYRANMALAKTTNPSWRTHIDDELLILAFPALLLHEEDPELRRLYSQALDAWHTAVKDEGCPFFDFAYAWLAGWPVESGGAVSTLREFPLDLVRWTVDNSRRADLGLVRTPELEHVQTDRLPPISERGTPRPDDNPWIAVQGDGGATESDGVYWLLPYWLGRAKGLIR